MTLATMVSSNKTHIIYIAILIGVIGAAYTLLSRKPKEIIKTQKVTETVTKVIVQKADVKTHIVTETKKSNGDVVTQTEDIVDNSTTKTQDKESLTITKTEVQKFLSSYTISAMYPLSTKDIANPVFNPLNLQIVGGIRVFSLPIFFNVGANVKLNTVLLGVTLEL